MSRYTEVVHDVRYAWGFDEPLSEYFFHAEKVVLEEYEDEDDAVIFSIGNHFVTKPHPSYPNKMTYTNGELLALMEDIVPKNHLRAILLDVPF